MYIKMSVAFWKKMKKSAWMDERETWIEEAGRGQSIRYKPSPFRQVTVLRLKLLTFPNPITHAIMETLISGMPVKFYNTARFRWKESISYTWIRFLWTFAGWTLKHTPGKASQPFSPTPRAIHISIQAFPSSHFLTSSHPNISSHPFLIPPSSHPLPHIPFPTSPSLHSLLHNLS